MTDQDEIIATPVGSLAGMRLDEECRFRRRLLDGLGTDGRQRHAERMCRELMALRDETFRCALADLCAGRGCPLAATVRIEEIDRGLLSLAAMLPALAGPEERHGHPRG